MLSLKSVAFALSVVLAFVAATAITDEAATNKLDVKIYYESLCWDSVQFISKQLQPSMTNKGRLAYANVKFVPYGKVVTYKEPSTNQTVLLCQHGRNECRLNSLHACIIENTTDSESYDMITCLMKGFTRRIEKCAAEYGISLEAAYQCSQTRSIAQILKKYGNDTNALNLSFVPTITFNGVYDYYEQEETLRNFDGVFCNHYKNKFNVTLTGC